MATKDDRPNLLSKVALFVRNPTKDWAELDDPESMLQSGYDRGAIKAAIERKRQNDFVRRREFDQLRKLRKSQANGEVAQVRPSLFQSSTVTDPDARALTLKKIDEIEAQMSKQWWKGKAEGAAAPTTLPPVQSESASAPSTPNQAPETNFPATRPMPDLAPAAEFAPTLAASSGVPTMGDLVGVKKAGAPKPTEAAMLAFSTSQLFASGAQDMTTDPELEEAAIRFANSDDAGAESVLLQALRTTPGNSEVATSWWTALLDLYRATGKRSAFDQAVSEFSTRFPSTAMRWLNYGDAPQAPADVASPLAPAGAPARPVSAVAVLWHCPPHLDQAAMEHLRDLLSTHPMPWRLDWSALQSVGDEAIPLLAGLFGSLCAEPVSVEFAGAAAVVALLRTLTPVADRSVEHGRWVLRLDALRVMQRIDDFELAALDYCVTFEVAPPPWMPATCHYSEWDGPQDAAAPQVVESLPVAPPSMEGTATPDGVLQGELLGDASAALAPLQPALDAARQVVVSCAPLLRVDFAAAGSILNWAATQQAKGCSLQFVEVHRLVAAFFNVIGINEHARVIPRKL